LLNQKSPDGVFIPCFVFITLEAGTRPCNPESVESRSREMSSVIAWRCACGCKVRVVFKDGGTGTIRCPKHPVCKKIHEVDGTISQVWIEDNGFWQPYREISRLIIGGRQRSQW